MRAMPHAVRSWGPLLAGFDLTLAALFVGPVMTWLMLTAAFCLLLDGATVMWERAGSVGNLSTHRQ